MFVSEGLCQISSLGQRGNYLLITNQTKGDAIEYITCYLQLTPPNLSAEM